MRTGLLCLFVVLWVGSTVPAQEAREVQKGLAKTHPDVAAGLLQNVGMALLDQGRPAEAAAQFRRLIALRPGRPEGHENLGLALMQEGRLAEAVAPLEAAIRLEPNRASPYQYLGTVLQRMGRPEAAKPFLARARELARSTKRPP